MTVTEPPADPGPPDPGDAEDVLLTPFARDFEAFYQETYPRAVRVALASTGRLDIAEELAQEAFLSAHLRWARVSSYDDPGAWVCRVVVNRGISTWRRRTAEVRALTRVRARPTVTATLPERDGQLWAEVRRLPHRQAQVLLLASIGDLTAPQIATHLGISENSVRTHLRRARQALAGRLGSTEENAP